MMMIIMSQVKKKSSSDESKEKFKETLKADVRDKTEMFRN